MVVPGWTLNHAKRQALEDELDVLLTQERLLRDLKESMVPLERLKTEKRGTHLLDGECTPSVSHRNGVDVFFFSPFFSFFFSFFFFFDVVFNLLFSCPFLP